MNFAPLHVNANDKNGNKHGTTRNNALDANTAVTAQKANYGDGVST